MAWLTQSEFKNLYVTESATEISADQIEQCLDEAKDELIALCGDAAAAKISAASPLSADADLIKRFRRAQGKLAYRELLLIMSSRFRSGGIVAQERDENAVTTNQYEKFADVEKRREILYAEAVRIVGRYLIAADERISGGIEFSHPVQNQNCCGDYGNRIIS